jgi:hypothetical protein
MALTRTGINFLNVSPGEEVTVASLSQFSGEILVEASGYTYYRPGQWGVAKLHYSSIMADFPHMIVSAVILYDRTTFIPVHELFAGEPLLLSVYCVQNMPTNYLSLGIWDITKV